MRNRVEDLGRLAVLLKNILDEDLFMCIYREEDFVKHYVTGKDQEIEHKLEKLFDRILIMRSRILACLEIANGTDDLTMEHSQLQKKQALLAERSLVEDYYSQDSLDLSRSLKMVPSPQSERTEASEDLSQE